MAELELNTPGFEIQVILEDTRKKFFVKPGETSDGVAYYNCLLNGIQLTQLRLDEDKWEQVWGNLDQSEIDAIGTEIMGFIKTQ